MLCGGSGTRLWPLSRRARPKQFLDLGTGETLLESTIVRCAAFGSPWLVGADEQRFLLTAALRRTGHPVRVIGEPSPRNTAAAACLASLVVARRDPGRLVLLCPADHHIEAPGAFVDAVQRGSAAAADGGIVVFGVEPSTPHTGYGWIEGQVSGAVQRVRRFVEKPDRQHAERFLASGMTWNAGIFLFDPVVLLGELERFEPRLVARCQEALRQGEVADDRIRVAPGPWQEAPTLPIDRAVMERTDRAFVVPVDMGWTDLGSYDALHERTPPDPSGNAEHGRVLSLDCEGSYLHGEGLLVTGVGLKDLVVVGTPDAVFVAPRARSTDVKRVVEGLGSCPEVAGHPRGERPWGRYRVLDRGERHQVKRLVVRPGGVLSLQRHEHRLEHWVIVEGRGQVTLGPEREPRNVLPGDAVRIEPGQVHRLECLGDAPLVLVEVQIGTYLGEDDIERLEDVYGRATGD